MSDELVTNNLEYSSIPDIGKSANDIEIEDSVLGENASLDDKDFKQVVNSLSGLSPKLDIKLKADNTSATSIASKSNHEKDMFNGKLHVEKFGDIEAPKKEEKVNITAKCRLYIFDLDDISERSECEALLTRAYNDTNDLAVQVENKKIDKDRTFYILEEKERNFNVKDGSYSMFISIVEIQYTEVGKK